MADSGSVGWGFESLRSHLINLKNPVNTMLQGFFIGFVQELFKIQLYSLSFTSLKFEEKLDYEGFEGII
jgi:hypothetical protein